MPPFVKAACGGLEDFGFEVSEAGKISFDSTILTDENEWKEDVDEWMDFFHYEFDFLDERGRKRNIPKTYLIKSSRKTLKPFEVEHRREGLGNKRTSQITAVKKESAGFPFSLLRSSRDSDDSATSSSRYGKTGPADSVEKITVKGLSRNNMRRSFPANQPMLIMNMSSRSSTKFMTTGLHKQRKSATAAGVTLTPNSSSTSSRKPVFKSFRLGRR